EVIVGNGIEEKLGVGALDPMIVRFEVPRKVFRAGEGEDFLHHVSADFGELGFGVLLNVAVAHDANVLGADGLADGNGALGFLEIAVVAVGVADADRRGEAENLDAGIFDFAGSSGEAAVEGGNLSDVELSLQTAEVDAVEAEFSGVRKERVEIPRGTAEGGEG